MSLEFNNMTIMAALEVIESYNSHPKLEALEIEWQIHGRCSTASKAAHIADLAKITINENPIVLTPEGRMKLERAIIHKALEAPSGKRERASWRKLIAGLKIDGFEIVEGDTEVIPASLYSSQERRTRLILQRMLPDDIEGLEFREAENEIIALLTKHNMNTAAGHLSQAMHNYTLGNWASCNSQIRSFVEDSFDFFANKLGYEGTKKGKDSRDFLGKSLEQPFLLNSVREWGEDNRDYLVQAILNRLSMEGNHPGLSDEENCTYNLQLALISMRLFLRRFNQRA